MDIVKAEFCTREEMYSQVKTHVTNIFEETQDLYAALSNVSAVLKLYLEHTNWTGFYLVKQGGLTLGPFQGKPAIAHIPFGKGVCGAAVESGKVQRVDDVEGCCHHIACDLASRSEIVTPIFVHGAVFGVIDIDSPALSRFDTQDEAGLKEVAERLAEEIERLEEQPL